MFDITSPDPDSKSMVVSNPISSANCPGTHTGGAPADAPRDDGRGEFGEEIGGDTEGFENHTGQHTGSVAGEPIDCPGSINAAVNQVSQTVLVNIRPPHSSARRTAFSLPHGFLPFNITRESGATSLTLRVVVRKSLLRHLFYLFLAALIVFLYVILVFTWHIVHPAGVKCYTTCAPRY